MTPPPTDPTGPVPRTARRLPRPSELRPLLRLARPDPDPVRRRLARAHTVADLREIARRRTPRAVFDYTDGAAEGEVSLRRARAAFAEL
jgi:L-lactate dehydrogenase (cytochrome)